MARRLVDCQYFSKENFVVIHEIVDGERNYQIIKDPDFHYYIEPELKKLKKETKYYKLINELERVDCKYADRYNSIANKIFNKRFDDLSFTVDFGLSKEKAAELEERYYSKERMLMANHNLYSADDSIEFRTIMEYYEKYKDEIDESIPLNYLFFDIETHSDFRIDYYQELEKLLLDPKNYKLTDEDIDLSPYKDLMETDSEEDFKYIINFYKEKSRKENFLDARVFLALAGSKMRTINKELVLEFFRAINFENYVNYFKDNIGFPDETKGNNRIDAISFVDVTKRKLYMYLLNVPEDLVKKDEREYIINEKLVQSELFKFIELFSIISYLKNIDKNNEKACKELLDNLDFLNHIYLKRDELNVNEKDKLNELIELAKNVIPNYEKEVKIDVEYKIFDYEKDMILDFFHKLKFEIKPSIIAAHNARFDINTIRNRLEKFGVDFDYEVNQLTELGDEFKRLKTKIKIDYTTMERKKDKTKYEFPGIVMLDTLLLYAKLSSKEKDWSLDAIAKEELNDSKIKYDFSIQDFYFKDVKLFIKYSAVDTLLLMRLEEKIQFISLFQLILSCSKTNWVNYVYRTSYLTNLIKYEMTRRKDGHFILRNNLTFLNPKKEKQKGSTKEVSYKGAYNTTLDGICDTFGFHKNLFDLDFTAFYPSCAITTNIALDQLLFTTEQKELHNDYIFMSKIGFGCKYFNLPSSDEIYKEL